MQTLPHYFHKMDKELCPEDSTIRQIRCWLSYITKKFIIPVLLQPDIIISWSEPRNASLTHYPLDHKNKDRRCVLINCEDDKVTESKFQKNLDRLK